MKKVFTLALMGILLVSTSHLSWAKKQKTGKIEDHTFIDSKFAYQLSFLKNWKLKDEKEPSLLRASLMKKNYQIDQLSKQSREEFNIPTIMIIADTTSLSIQEFKKELFTEKAEKIKNKDYYLITLEFLTGSEIMDESETQVDSVPAIILTMRKPFERLVKDPTLVNAPLGDKRLVNDFLIGFILLLKKYGNVYLIHFSCERQFFGNNQEEFVNIMEGWKFIK